MGAEFVFTPKWSTFLLECVMCCHRVNVRDGAGHRAHFSDSDCWKSYASLQGSCHTPATQLFVRFCQRIGLTRLRVSTTSGILQAIKIYKIKIAVAVHLCMANSSGHAVHLCMADSSGH
jgi:hypothetical protein